MEKEKPNIKEIFESGTGKKMRIKIKDLEKSDYYQMPKNIYEYDLKPVHRELYMLCLNNWRLSIQNNWINENGEIYFYATQDTLVQKMKIRKETLINAFKKLIEVGLLEVEKNNGKANKYYLLKTKNASTENSTSTKNDTSNENRTATSTENSTTTSTENSTRLRTTEKKQKSKNELKEKDKKEKAQNEIENFINSLEKSEEYKKLLFEFVKYRKKIKKSLKTIKPIENVIRNFCNAEKLSEALEIMQEKEWQSVEPEWVENYKKSKKGAGNNANNSGNSKEKGFNKHTDYKPDYSTGWEDWN